MELKSLTRDELDNLLVTKREELAEIKRELGIRPDSELTKREKEVISLLRDGYSNKEISEKLAISHTTVKAHVRAILGKLGARNRAQAVALTIKQGLI